MLGREVVESQQRVAVPGEAFDRPAVLGAVFLGEDVDRRFGGRPVRRQSYAGFWVTGRSGGVVCRHVDDLDAVVESDTCNHLRQLICAFEPPPGF